MDPWVTGLVLALATAGIIAWDIALAVDGEPGNTISQVVRRTSRRWLVLPFALGVVMGHIFWPS